MKYALKNLSALALVFGLSAIPASAVTLNLDSNSGKLVGASGVTVGTTVFDVEFRLGTCVELFNGCNDPTDFIFDRDTAILASEALLQQVLLDGPLGNFDTNASLTLGCWMIHVCGIRTPYAGYSGSMGPREVSGFALNSGTGGVFIDFTGWNNKRATTPHGYAIWKASDTAAASIPTGVVPLPAGIVLLMTGLSGMVALRRWKTRAA